MRYRFLIAICLAAAGPGSRADDTRVPAEGSAPILLEATPVSRAAEVAERERQYEMLYALGAITLAAAAGGIAMRRRMLRQFEAESSAAQGGE